MESKTYVRRIFSNSTISFITAVWVLLSIFSTQSCVTNQKYNLAKLNEAKTNSDNEKLRLNVKDLASSNTDLRSQNSSLHDKNSTCENKLNNLNGELNILGNSNQSKSKELKMSKDELLAQRKRLVELQNKIDLQLKYTELIREKITNALVAFTPDELLISVKNGKVYVSMQEGLLFPSGSAQINKKGKDALLKVAEVLKENADINVNIEGHTDTVKIHNKQYADNWALSTARATAIAHVMIEDYNVQPERITASGRSQYAPVSENVTSTGRQLNRRTEIILEPKLSELMDMIYNSTASVNATK